MYPRCKIYLNLLLPTKLESLNHRVKDFNSILHEISYRHKNVYIIDKPISQLCGSNGCLKEEFGRFDRQSGSPLARDTLHLGKKGLRLFAASIKSAVMGK